MVNSLCSTYIALENYSKYTYRKTIRNVSLHKYKIGNNILRTTNFSMVLIKHAVPDSSKNAAYGYCKCAGSLLCTRPTLYNLNWVIFSIM